ncbi:MAG: hypothetical protein QOK48_3431 [Blastocatellia bacterium]|jgi:ankyrin repeat protein|nr:hypothetical protein [Blastocatellia bacterium]
MNRVFTKTILLRVFAFLATTVFSVALMNSLPRIKEQRQRSFARATMDGKVGRMRWLHFAGAKVDTRTSLGSPLFLAASSGKLRAVRYLLDEGAEVNCREAGGSSPLIEAAYNGHVEVIKELLLRGAEVNAISDYGTALDIAISRRNSATVEVLRHLGARTTSEIRAGN